MAAIYAPPPPAPVPVPETPTKAPVTPKKKTIHSFDEDAPGTTKPKAAEHNVTVTESAASLSWLASQHFNLALAKYVTTGEETTSNVIFQTRDASPTTAVSWVQSYALSYTLAAPTPGNRVIPNGVWNACQPGETYELGGEGIWDLVDDKGKEGSLSVTNNYKPATIIIGVKLDVGKTYVPIWYSPSKLPRDSTGVYFPSEDVDFWYGTNVQTGYVRVDSNSQKTKVQSVDFTDAYIKFLTYSSQGDSWDVNENGPSATLTRPLPSGFWRRVVEFTLPVHDQMKFIQHVRTHLHDRGWQAYVTVAVPNNSYLITATDIEGSHDPAGEDNFESDLYAVLEELLVEKILPRNEEWLID